MTTSRTLPYTRWKGIWIGVRFVLFGVLGFLVMLLSFIMLLVRLSPGHHTYGETSPFLLAPLPVLGALMVLFGVGEWGRWGYMLVFVAIPVSLLSLLLMPTSEEAAVIIPTLAAAVTLKIVHRYYVNKGKGDLKSKLTCTAFGRSRPAADASREANGAVVACWLR